MLNRRKMVVDLAPEVSIEWVLPLPLLRRFRLAKVGDESSPGLISEERKSKRHGMPRAWIMASEVVSWPPVPWDLIMRTRATKKITIGNAVAARNTPTISGINQLTACRKHSCGVGSSCFHVRLYGTIIENTSAVSRTCTTCKNVHVRGEKLTCRALNR